jgi:Fe-S cluster assembly ATP-binding protein
MTFLIDKVSVAINEHGLLDNISLKIQPKESMIMFGPNGSGKSSLVKAIMNLSSYTITKGKILLDNEDITSLSADEKTKKGLGFAFQQPPEIIGIKLIDLLKVCEKKKRYEPLSDYGKELVKKLDMESFLQRDIHVGFSGGERKRAELLQLLLLKPKLLLLDEIDSGVDIESLALMATEIQNYIHKENASALIITHSGYILDYIDVEKGVVLLNNTIYCHNHPKKIFEDIKKKGYKGCIKCLERNKGELC